MFNKYFPVRQNSQTLVLQKQLLRECWESVESNIAQKLSPGIQSHISTNNKPIQVDREKLAELLRVLNLPCETIDQVSQAYFSSPQVSLLSILLSALPEPTSTSSRDETNKKASVPSSNQEVGLETKLSLIEGKYEKILQQVTKLVD